MFSKSLTTLVASLLIAGSMSANAQKVFEVTSLAGDSSNGSLAAAISASNAQATTAEAPNTIKFAQNLSGEIVLSKDLPAITTSVNIEGNLSNGKPAVTINGSVDPSGNSGIMAGKCPGFSIFAVNSGNVSISNLAINKSNQSGIVNNGGNVTVSNCFFSYNMGIAAVNGTAGGFQQFSGNAVIDKCYFYYNTGGAGGTDGTAGNGGAGAINVEKGNLVVMNTSIFDNEGGFGGVGVGSIGGAGAVSNIDGYVTIANCSLIHNFGGGSIVTGASGGVTTIKGYTSLIQSTICNNWGGAGYGGFGGVIFCCGGVHVLDNGSMVLGGNVFSGNINGNDEAIDFQNENTDNLRFAGVNFFNEAPALEGSNGVKASSALVSLDGDGNTVTETVYGFVPMAKLVAGSPASAKGSASVLSEENFIPEAAAQDWFKGVWAKYGADLQAKVAGTPDAGAIAK